MVKMRFVFQMFCFQVMLAVIVHSEQQTNTLQEVDGMYSIEESNYVTPTKKEMDDYWFEKFHYCGKYLRDSKEEICRTFYYGRLSPFRSPNYEPPQMSRRNRRNIDSECCASSCNRWTVKDYCDPDPDKYSPTQDSVASSKRFQALRSEMDKYWTVEVQHCGSSLGDNVFAMCKMLFEGQYSPLLIPDYTPSNRQVVPKKSPTPSSRRTRSTNRRTKLIVQECCQAPCTRWTLKDYCYWHPRDHMPDTPPKSTTNAPATTRPPVTAHPTTSPTPAPTHPSTTKMPTTAQVPSTTAIPVKKKTPEVSPFACTWHLFLCPYCFMVCGLMNGAVDMIQAA